jgi:hypothetical protein
VVLQRKQGAPLHADIYRKHCERFYHIPALSMERPLSSRAWRKKARHQKRPRAESNRSPEQCRLSAGGMLPGDETEPGGKLPPMLEAGRIANGRDQGGRRQGPNAGPLHQSLTGFVSLTLLLAPVVRGRNTLIHSLERLGEGMQPLPGRGRQAVLGVFQKEGQCMPHLREPLRDHQPIFR